MAATRMAKRVLWTSDARLDLRAIDRETALRILKSETADIKQLEGFNPPQYRIRFGDWRLIFRKHGKDEIEILRVSHRREAYR